MRNGKYQNGRRTFGSKSVAALLAVILVMTCAVGGTLAWLTDKSDEVVNTFTVGDVQLTLTETTGETYKMVPGCTIAKDPIVTVLKDSEDCWVFIKVEKSKNLDEYIEFKIDENNWKPLPDAKGILPTEAVYYCYADNITADRRIKVLGPGEYTDKMDEANEDDDVTVTWDVNQVAVKPSVTEEMLEGLIPKNAARPMLTFTAYAVQKMKNNTESFTAAEAWAEVSQ